MCPLQNAALNEPSSSSFVVEGSDGITSLYPDNDVKRLWHSQNAAFPLCTCYVFHRTRQHLTLQSEVCPAVRQIHLPDFFCWGLGYSNTKNAALALRARRRVGGLVNQTDPPNWARRNQNLNDWALWPNETRSARSSSFVFHDVCLLHDYNDDCRWFPAVHGFFQSVHASLTISATKISWELAFPKASILGDEYKGIMKLAPHIGVPHNKCIYHKTSKWLLIALIIGLFILILICASIVNKNGIQEERNPRNLWSILRDNLSTKTVVHSMLQSWLVLFLYRTKCWSGCVQRVRLLLQTGMSRNWTADGGCSLTWYGMVGSNNGQEGGHRYRHAVIGGKRNVLCLSCSLNIPSTWQTTLRGWRRTQSSEASTGCHFRKCHELSAYTGTYFNCLTCAPCSCAAFHRASVRIDCKEAFPFS